MPQHAMRATFWGVRGSTPCPGAEYVGVGGNTSCVEVQTNTGRLILDAGTGLRALGDALNREAAATGQPVDVTLLVSHLHWDHIQGFPFFRPIFAKGTRVAIAGRSQAHIGFEEGFRAQLRAPYFPVPFDELAADVSFHELPDGPSLLAGAHVTTCDLHHPQSAIGFRLEAQGHSLCYVADHEAGDARADAAVVRLMRGADVVICDAQFTPAEYPDYRGWGHSHWRDVVRLARAADAHKLVLTHHDPWHDDAAMDAIERDARAEFPGAEVAREGRTIVV